MTMRIGGPSTISCLMVALATCGACQVAGKVAGAASSGTLRRLCNSHLEFV